MSLRYTFVIALALIALAACTTTEPTTTPPLPEPETVPADTVETPPEPENLPEPAPEPAPEPTPEAAPQPEPEAESDLLYELTEDELRVAFTDGLFGLYRAEVDPAAAQRLDAAGVSAWLTDLALVSPRAVEFARETLGPVLDQPYLVGFVLENAAAAECASVRDVLFIPVPERFQDAERPFDGYIVQDACDVTDGELARFCTGGFGETDDGTACSCVCTTGEAPGLDCVTCGDE